MARRSSNEEMKHFVRSKSKRSRVIPNNQLPPRTMSLAESRLIYPNNPHTWLCDGKLLRLLDSDDPTNYSIFRVCFNNDNNYYYVFIYGIYI